MGSLKKQKNSNANRQAEKTSMSSTDDGLARSSFSSLVLNKGWLVPRRGNAFRRTKSCGARGS